MTAYCKKCRRDMPPAELCPQCGAKLGRSALRVAWCVPHRPVADWMCWNAVLRLAVPALALVLGIVLLCETLSAGTAGL